MYEVQHRHCQPSCIPINLGRSDSQIQISLSHFIAVIVPCWLVIGMHSALLYIRYADAYQGNNGYILVSLVNGYYSAEIDDTCWSSAKIAFKALYHLQPRI